MKSSLVILCSSLLGMSVASGAIVGDGVGTDEAGNEIRVPHQGEPLPDVAKDRLRRVVRRMKEAGTVDGQNLDRCGRCLEEMLDKGRICLEGSADTNAKVEAATRPVDGTECNPDMHIMNVNPNLIFYDTRGFPHSLDEAAAILAHEWSHTVGFTEAQAYPFERKVLEKLGRTTRVGFRLVDKTSTELALADAVGVGRAPKKGFREYSSPDGGIYYVRYGEARFYYAKTSSDTVLNELNLVTLGIDHPTGLLPLPNPEVTAFEIVAIAGIADPQGNNSGTQGLIHFLKVKDGEVLGGLGTVALPGTHPTSLAYLPASKTLVVLDTLGNRMHQIILSGAPGAPAFDTRLFIDRAAFPEIENVLSITPSDNSIPNDDEVILAFAYDDRQGSAHGLSNDALNSMMYVLKANKVIRAPLPKGAALSFKPGFVTKLLTGRTELVLSGSLDGELVLQATDAGGNNDGEIIARGTVGRDYTARLSFPARPLRQGEFVKLVDMTDGFSPQVKQVLTPQAADVDGNFAVDINELTSLAAKWKRGEFNDIDALTRAAFLWRNTEYYYVNLANAGQLQFLPVNAFSDSLTVTVINNTGQPAADLHVTFSGTGGNVYVDPASVVAPGCGQPSIPSNGTVSNTIVIEWPNACVPAGGRVAFTAQTHPGPLRVVSGFWTGQPPARGNIGDLILARDVVTVASGDSHSLYASAPAITLGLTKISAAYSLDVQKPKALIALVDRVERRIFVASSHANQAKSALGAVEEGASWILPAGGQATVYSVLPLAELDLGRAILATDSFVLANAECKPVREGDCVNIYTLPGGQFVRSWKAVRDTELCFPGETTCVETFQTNQITWYSEPDCAGTEQTTSLTWAFCVSE